MSVECDSLLYMRIHVYMYINYNTVHLELFVEKYFRSQQQLRNLILRNTCTLLTKGPFLRKFFNVKICHTKVSEHKNFQIFGTYMYMYMHSTLTYTYTFLSVEVCVHHRSIN